MVGFWDHKELRRIGFVIARRPERTDYKTMEPVEFNYSVIVPFYRAEKYFEEALDSVLSQTCQPNEVIVVVDGRDEHTLSFLVRFKDSRIRIIVSEKNLGPSNARNLGVKAAETDWIAFIDADDIWDTHKISQQVEYLKIHQNIVGCHTGIRVFSKNSTRNIYTQKPTKLDGRSLVLSSQIVPSSLVIKRIVFTEIGGMDTSFKCCEDYDFSIRLIEAGHEIGFISEPLTRLRREFHGNLSANGWKLLRYRLKILITHNEFIKQHGGSKARRSYLTKTFYECGNRVRGVNGFALKAVGRILSMSK